MSSTPLAITGAVNCCSRRANERYRARNSSVAPNGTWPSSALWTNANTAGSAAGLRAARAGDRPVDVATILLAGLIDDVGAIDGEIRDHGFERLSQRVEREVARATIRARQTKQGCRQDRQLACQAGVHHQATTLSRDILEILRFSADERAPGPFQTGLRRTVDEQTVDEIGESIPGGAVNCPVEWQLLVRRDDLLGHDVEGT